ncbi:hypothetical protein V2G26_015439 [Clonostachys chloroleuca]
MQDANDQIAGTCLTFLLEPSILEPRSSTSSPPAYISFEDYATHYWVDHFKECTPSSSTRAEALRLFCGKRDVFEKWISRRGFGESWPAPLYYASYFGLTSILDALVDVGLSKESAATHNACTRAEPFFLNKVTSYGETALQAASLHGHLAIVQRLIEGGADIRQESGDFGTALLAAAIQGHLEIVQLLITKGADINQQSGSYGTALQAASVRGNLEIVELLIKKGANVDLEGDNHATALQAQSALQAASASGHIEIVKLLLKEGANTNQESSYYGTALQAASAFGHIEIIKLLLKEGANINQEGGYLAN